MTVYADILIITNIYIDMIIIECVRILTCSRLRTSRAILGAAVGSLFSLVIFLPWIGTVGMTAVRLLSAACTVLAAFGYGSRRMFLFRTFLLFTVGFVFAGICTAFAAAIPFRLIRSRNGVIYADISPAALIITSVAAYAVIVIYRRVTSSAGRGSYHAVISVRGRSEMLEAIADTGNLLCDIFTGKPVIVCPRERIAMLFDDIPSDVSADSLTEHWHLIPYRTVSGTGLIPVTAPDEVCITDDATGEIYRTDAYIGVSDSCETAVFDPKILL